MAMLELCQITRGINPTESHKIPLNHHSQMVFQWFYNGFPSLSRSIKIYHIYGNLQMVNLLHTEFVPASERSMELFSASLAHQYIPLALHEHSY